MLRNLFHRQTTGDRGAHSSALVTAYTVGSAVIPSLAERNGRKFHHNVIALYEQQLCAQVEPGNIGKFLVIDIETGDYEINAKELAAFPYRVFYLELDA